MLQTRANLDQIGGPARPADTSDASLLAGLDIVSLLAMARRHLKTVAISLVAGIALAVVCFLLTDTRFTAQASILIGNRQLRSIQDISAQSSQMAESTLVDNQTEVLHSERVLLAVIRKLKLTNDPEFNGIDPPPFPGQIIRVVMMLNPMRWFAATTDTDPAFKIERTTVGRLNDAIKITRVGKSNVLQLAVTAKGAKKSATITNAIAQAYLDDQVDARVDAAKSASDWFRDRLAELRKQSTDANNAVDAYRTQNNLIAANGQLVSDQQLTQLNNELATTNTDFVNKQARYDNLKSAMDSGRLDAIVTEALDNPVVSQLRQKLADTSKRYNEIVGRYGAKHEQAVNLKNQMSEYERLIQSELRRFLASYEGELKVAKERRDALTSQLSKATAVTVGANASLVRLRQLEQESTTLNGIYQTFLQRYQETIQQESFPMNDARIITEATAPLLPSEPRTVLLLALGIFAGLGVGGTIGAYREMSDHMFRTAEQVEEQLGVEVLGILPKIDTGQAVGTKAIVTGLRDQRSPASGKHLLSYTTKNPFSSYAEALRAVKIGLDGSLGGNRAKVIGIVSSIPREGKSTLAMNFASLLALQGSRVVLIDADLREAGLTRLAGLKPNAGLGEVLAGQVPLGEVLSADANTRLAIVPANVKHDSFLSGDLIASPAMDALLKSLSNVYDYVVVDLPPIGPIIDGRAAAHLLDAVVYVIEWGGVSRRLVRNALAASPAVRDKLVGAVLNKVELKKLRSYEPHLLDEAQEELYRKYYK